MLNVAIIGISGFGREHLRLMLWGEQEGLLNPMAAVVINPDEEVENVALLKSRGCKVFNSSEKMWKEMRGKIDLCMIPTPISTHYDLSIEAIKHGSHILLEKPLTGCLSDAHSLIEFAKSNNRKICVGFQNLYDPVVHQIKSHVLNGEIGEIQYIKGWGSWPRSHNYYSRSNWAGKRFLGNKAVHDSPINNGMAHFLMLMLYWAGEDFFSSGEVDNLDAELYRCQAIENFDTACLDINLKSGINIFYAVTHSDTEASHPLLIIQGEKGSIEWKTFDDVTIRIGDEVRKYQQKNTSYLQELMLTDIVSHIENDKPIAATADNVLCHTEVVEKLANEFSIKDVPKDQLQQVINGNGEYQTCRKGMAAIIEKCFEKTQFPSQLDAGLAD